VEPESWVLNAAGIAADFGGVDGDEHLAPVHRLYVRGPPTPVATPLVPLRPDQIIQAGLVSRGVSPDLHHGFPLRHAEDRFLGLAFRSPGRRAVSSYPDRGRRWYEFARVTTSRRFVRHNRIGAR
jgi:hypothetical protein